MKSGWAALVVSACFLAGCGDGQQAAKAEAIRHCVAGARSHTARRTDQSRDDYQSEEEYTDFLFKPVEACMNAAGFVHDPSGPLCTGAYEEAVCWDVKNPNRLWRFLSHYGHYL